MLKLKNINNLYLSVLKSAYGLSMGSIWQHLGVESEGLPDNYHFRKETFFIILTRLLNEKKIKLAANGVFLSGTVEQQILLLQASWPQYPAEDEFDDLDEYGMWFLTRAPAGVVWLTADDGEVWT